jgi:hypothetical protein
MARLLVMAASLLVLALPVAAASTAAAAYDPLGGVCGSLKNGNTSASTPDSTCDGQNGSKAADPNATLRKASTLIAVIAGIAAVIIIIVSGIQYVTSGGNSQQTSTARLALIGALVGLIIIVVAQSVILLVLSRVK